MRVPTASRALCAFVAAIILSCPSPLCAGPTIGTIYPTSSPRANKRFELTFTITNIQPQGVVFPTDGSVGYNPFWQDTSVSGPISTAPGVKVWATITDPDGVSFTLDGFWCVEYEYLGDSQAGYDRIVPINHPQTGTAEHWHVRFIPTKAGTYAATVYADDPDPSLPTSVTTSFTIASAATGDNGILRVSSDRQRLEYANGEPYCQMGFAMQQGCPAVETTPVLNGKKGLEILADAGGNFIRRWLVNTSREDIYRGISWHVGTVEETDVSDAHRGTRARRLAGDTSIITAVDRSFLGCRPNRTYTASVWYKATLGGTGTARIRVNESDGSVTTEHFSPWIASSDQNWQQITFTFTTNDTAKWLHFRPELGAGSSGSFYLDDMDLRDTTPGSAVDFNVLQNPSFEDWSPVQLDVANLWRLDYCLAKCENLGIKAQLCLFDYRLWNSIPSYGLYYTWYGGGFWGDRSSGVWQETDAIRQQKRVMRYLAARYGGFTSVGLWELTNEMSPWYSESGYAWLTEMSRYLQSIDRAYGGQPDQRPVTNSTWFSPADSPGYEQIPNMQVSSVHSYMYTDTHPDLKNRVPGWGINGNTLDSSSYISPPHAYHAVVTWPDEQEASTLLGRSFGTHPNRHYKLSYWTKIGSIAGSTPRFHAQCFRGDAIDNSIAEYTQIVTAPTDWVRNEITWTNGASDARVSIRFQVLDTSSIEIWMDDIELHESTDGLNWKQIVYNCDFSICDLGDDELIWALYDCYRFRENYTAGPNGCDKPWLSGETGLFEWSAGAETWVYSQYTNSDTTGIHSHNAVWAQVMANGAVSSPCYWFSNEYMVEKALAGVDVYTPTWKGISQFVKALPFRSGSQRITTEPFFSEVPGVISTNPKIRLVGRKKENKAYFWVSNSVNTWSNRIARGNAAEYLSATISIPGFPSGTYALSRYDSYTGVVQSQSSVLVQNDGILRVEVVNLGTDTAYIVSQQGPLRQHPMFVADGSTISVPGLVAISNRNDETGVYLETPDRTWGIKVVPPSGISLSRGQQVNVRGILRTSNGERYLEIPASGLYEISGSTTLPDPLAIPNKALGGAASGQYTPTIKNGVGLYNVGLLVQCVGKVTYIGDRYFYLDDGSALLDGSGRKGIRVETSYTSLGYFVDDWVVVTGISSTAIVGGRVVRAIRLRLPWEVFISWSPKW